MKVLEGTKAQLYRMPFTRYTFIKCVADRVHILSHERIRKGLRFYSVKFGRAQRCQIIQRKLTASWIDSEWELSIASEYSWCESQGVCIGLRSGV